MPLLRRNITSARVRKASALNYSSKYCQMRGMWRHNWFVCLFETSLMDCICIFNVFKHDPLRDVHFKLNQRPSVIIHKNLNNTWMNSHNHNTKFVIDGSINCVWRCRHVLSCSFGAVFRIEIITLQLQTVNTITGCSIRGCQGVAKALCEQLELIG